MFIILFSSIYASLRRGGAVSRLALAFLGLTAIAHAKPVAFDIPAQSAADALIVFSKQSKADVLYSFKDLSGARSRAVVGEFEPAAAIALLLKDTGFIATLDEGKFVVVREKLKPGSISGSLVLANSGAAAAGVTVTLRETGAMAITGRTGGYVFTEVPAGAYTLLATAEGFSRLKITDVTVTAGKETTLSVQSMPVIKRDGVVQLMEEFVVSAKGTELMDKFEVSDARTKPFSAGNMDIARTINDAQPYTIFDAKTIDQSGAVSVEDFLKQRLTMNTTSMTNGLQTGGASYGNLSAINLRGVGTDKTLILVNGRRQPGITYSGTTELQPDLNGIPLSMIERIEVLPTSAAGIYGGGAIGGVINVILKQNYTGGELRASYDNIWDTDAPRRTASLSYGFSLEGGKTHVMLSGSWADASGMVRGDRRAILEQSVATITANSPTYFTTTTSPWLGALPNITPSSATQTNLILKNGAVINSRLTFVPAGTAPTTSTADLYASLVANGGKWNLDFPPTTQSGTGLLAPFGLTPKSRAVRASVRRQMTTRLEMFADFAYAQNSTTSTFNNISTFNVPVAAPTNPFTTAVVVRFPNAAVNSTSTNSETWNATVGAIAHLPGNWTAELDYTWSKNRYRNQNVDYDTTAINTDLLNGTVNPFVDLLRYPPALTKYLTDSDTRTGSVLQSVTLRGAGPLPALPWGTPQLTVGLEHRVNDTPANRWELFFPLTPNLTARTTYFGTRAATDSAYLEATVPMVKQGWLRGVHALDLQVSGRSERFTVDTGTTSSRSTYLAVPPGLTYNGPTLNGRPYRDEADYTSSNYTVGFKYQPVQELTLRASIASAFLPPTPPQLAVNPTTDVATITDPKTGQTGVLVTTSGGGNPNLVPQTSKSQNAGIIWEPRWKLLQGLRLNAEYYKIEQFNFIGTLGAQALVNVQDFYPERITRDATGTITRVDASALNLYHRETEGWDLGLDYTLRTRAGTFNLHAVESIIMHLKSQYSKTQPEYDGVNYPADTNGAAKYKSNATLTWEWHRWTAGWTTNYYGAYRQNGAVGSPSANVRAATGTTPAGRLPATTYTLPQGGDAIPSQLYHDVFVGYAFGKPPGGETSRLRVLGNRLVDGLSVQFGVRNVFNKIPPLDVYYPTNFYRSPYGDMRLRSYWVSVKKAF